MICFRSFFGPRLHAQHVVYPPSAQMTNLLLIEALCVDARRSTQRASDCIAHCLARTSHERERIAAWVAFRGRWQLPMYVFIMKEIETALLSPLRGDRAMPEEDSYMEMAEIVRINLMTAYRTSDAWMDYLARLLEEREMTEGCLRRSLDELDRAGRLCNFLERQLGLVLDAAPWPVGLLTAEIQ